MNWLLLSMVLLNDILPLVSGNAITDCVGTDIPAIIRGSTVSIRCFGSISGENPSGDYLRESKNRLWYHGTSITRGAWTSCAIAWWTVADSEYSISWMTIIVSRLPLKSTHHFLLCEWYECLNAWWSIEENPRRYELIMALNSSVNAWKLGVKIETSTFDIFSQGNLCRMLSFNERMDRCEENSWTPTCFIHWMRWDIWQKNGNWITIMSAHMKLSVLFHLPNMLENTMYLLLTFSTFGWY